MKFDNYSQFEIFITYYMQKYINNNIKLILNRLDTFQKYLNLIIVYIEILNNYYA